jgi:hypothetical protein
MHDTFSGTFFESGWAVFDFDPLVNQWIDIALPFARAARADPQQVKDWLRCDGTWFAGVNALPNLPDGSLPGSRPLKGEAVDFVHSLQPNGPIDWDKGQVSICYRGYPKQGADESKTALQYRLNRDSAHVDGLHPVGAARRRYLKERHAFILGLPMTQISAEASSMVVWEGSHEIVRSALSARLQDIDPMSWDDVDLTETYHAARREIFATCTRVLVHAVPGQAYVVHRLALHGVSPWQDGAKAPEMGRAIAYFRPELTGDTRDWLTLP